MKAGKYRVVYRVTFECDVVVGDDDHWEDKISDIDVPEGGQNGSVYCEDSFEITDYQEPEGDTCKCGEPFTAKDIDGGRCLSCGTMICAEESGDE